MKISQICKKLADLLYKDKNVYNGSVCFDFSSYEYENDIPYIILNKVKLPVEIVIISRDGNIIEIFDDMENYHMINLSDYTEDELISIYINGLLFDVYYETSYAYEIGDFEEDFLKI